MIGADAIIKCLEAEGVSTVSDIPVLPYVLFQQHSGF